MDIRVIDKRRVVNVSRLSLEVQGKYVVGLTDEGKVVNVKGCYDKQEAEKLMDRIIEEICEGVAREEREIIIVV